MDLDQPIQRKASGPPGQGRVWFYRLWDPSESLNVADIDMNGVYVGSVELGGAIYRYVCPGPRLRPIAADDHVDAGTTLALRRRRVADGMA